jgi:hypothetical protein
MKFKDCISKTQISENTELIQGDQKVYVHLMITIQKVTSNVQSVPRLTTWLNLTGWQPTARASRTLDSH